MVARDVSCVHLVCRGQSVAEVALPVEAWLDRPTAAVARPVRLETAEDVPRPAVLLDAQTIHPENGGVEEILPER